MPPIWLLTIRRRSPSFRWCKVETQLLFPPVGIIFYFCLAKPQKDIKDIHLIKVLGGVEALFAGALLGHLPLCIRHLYSGVVRVRPVPTMLSWEPMLPGVLGLCGTLKLPLSIPQCVCARSGPEIFKIKALLYRACCLSWKQSNSWHLQAPSSRPDLC